MKLFKTADELLEETGFVKASEEACSVQYEKKNEECNFIQDLVIVYREDGNHLVFSYVKDVNAEGYNNAVGLTPNEMKYALKKIRELNKNSWK